MDFPAVPDGDPIRVSASTFVAYQQCPAQAAARLDGIYGPESVVAFRGGLAHAVFARHLQAGPIEEGSFTQVCYESIGSSNLNHKLAPLGLKPSSLASVIAEVRDLYDRFKMLSADGFEAAEVDLDVEPVPGVQLVGRVDAQFDDDGRVRLVDWKTGELGEAATQLSFYALLWTLRRDRLPDVVEAISVRTGERYRDEPTSATVADMAARVAAVVTAIRTAWSESTDHARLAGPWCQYCPVVGDCDEGSAVMALTTRKDR